MQNNNAKITYSLKTNICITERSFSLILSHEYTIMPLMVCVLSKHVLILKRELFWDVLFQKLLEVSSTFYLY